MRGYTNLAVCVLGWQGVATTSVQLRNAIKDVACVQISIPLRNSIKDLVYKKLCELIVPSTVAALAVSLSQRQRGSKL